MNTWIKIVILSVFFIVFTGSGTSAMGVLTENTNPRMEGSAFRLVDGPVMGPQGADIPHDIFTGPAVSGVMVFPADHIWNTRADVLPVDTQSSAYVKSIGIDSWLHADFGSGLYEGNPIGIPLNIVNRSQSKRTISFDYADESDPGPYPVPDNPFIEGGSDHHLLIIDTDAQVLYELFAAEKHVNGSWSAGSGAVYNLSGYALRPKGWTSADAAGLAILPGLARYDEADAGEITHALRFTAPSTRQDYVWPARHFASSITDPAYPPMGQRFRLKSSFNISGYPYQARIVLQALKKYGMILSDNGAPWYITGVPDERWNNDALHTLHQLKGSDFEAVDCSSLMIHENSGQARITSANTTPADQTGEFRSGIWYLDYHSDGFLDQTFHFGKAGDIPVVGDWDGDGISDTGVFRPANGDWYLETTKTGAVNRTYHFGKAGDIPVVGDWDGDGISDTGVFRPANGDWYLETTKTGAVNRTYHFGKTGDVPVTGDWDEDGISDTGVFRPVNGDWYLETTKTGTVNRTYHFGKAGDIPVVGDWDGDGISDTGVFRPVNGDWYLETTKTGAVTRTFHFGKIGDVPVTGVWQM